MFKPIKYMTHKPTKTEKKEQLPFELTQIPEEPVRLKLNLNDPSKSKPPAIEPISFQRNSKLNFILTPQLQSQNRIAVPLLSEYGTQHDKQKLLFNTKKQSSVSAKTRNTHSGFMLESHTSRGKKSDIFKPAAQKSNNTYNIAKYLQNKSKENINPKPTQKDIEQRKKELNDKLLMLSSHANKQQTPLQESIDSNEPCNVVNSSSEFSESIDACKKQPSIDQMTQGNAHEIEIIPIQEYGDQNKDELGKSVSRSLSFAGGIPPENQELLTDTYICLKTCYHSLCKLKEISNEMYTMREESELLEEERIMKWQITAGVLAEFAKSISVDKIDFTLEKIDKVLNSVHDIKFESCKGTTSSSSTDASNSSTLYKKYEKQIDKLKEENSKLIHRNKELENAWASNSELKESQHI